MRIAIIIVLIIKSSTVFSQTPGIVGVYFSQLRSGKSPNIPQFSAESPASGTLSGTEFAQSPCLPAGKPAETLRRKKNLKINQYRLSQPGVK